MFFRIIFFVFSSKHSRQDDELSYALGKQGGTRKKLERSSGAVVQYVGQTALFSGSKAERKRAKDGGGT